MSMPCIHIVQYTDEEEVGHSLGSVPLWIDIESVENFLVSAYASAG